MVLTPSFGVLPCTQPLGALTTYLQAVNDGESTRLVEAYFPAERRSEINAAIKNNDVFLVEDIKRPIYQLIALFGEDTTWAVTDELAAPLMNFRVKVHQLYQKWQLGMESPTGIEVSRYAIPYMRVCRFNNTQLGTHIDELPSPPRTLTHLQIFAAVTRCFFSRSLARLFASRATSPAPYKNCATVKEFAAFVDLNFCVPAEPLFKYPSTLAAFFRRVVKEAGLEDLGFNVLHMHLSNESVNALRFSSLLDEGVDPMSLNGTTIVTVDTGGGTTDGSACQLTVDGARMSYAPVSGDRGVRSGDRDTDSAMFERLLTPLLAAIKVAVLREGAALRKEDNYYLLNETAVLWQEVAPGAEAEDVDTMDRFTVEQFKASPKFGEFWTAWEKAKYHFKDASSSFELPLETFVSFLDAVCDASKGRTPFALYRTLLKEVVNAEAFKGPPALCETMSGGSGLGELLKIRVPGAIMFS